MKVLLKLDLKELSKNHKSYTFYKLLMLHQSTSGYQECMWFQY